MNRLCALDIQDNYVIALDIEKKGNVYSLAEHHIIDLSELPLHIKNRENFFLSIDQDEEVDEKVSLASVIKNDAVIRGSILLKLAEQTANRKLMFNYYEIAQKEKSENSTYQVDGVYEKEYLDRLNLIDDISQIESSTLSKFALFGISQECIKEESYFSIYTSSNKITTIAVHKNEIVYSRTNSVVARNAELRILNMVAEINQTINYVKGQFRDIKFSTIAFSGTIAIDDTIAEHLYLSISDINITILYPNTFIRGIENEDVQSYIIALGALFVPKKFQFLPISVHGIKQYKLVSKILFIASFVPLLVLSFFTVEKYLSYSDSFEKYETIKDRLTKIVKNTQTYPQGELQKSLNYLEIVEKHLEYHPVDLITVLKPLIKLQKAETFEWNYIDGNIELKAAFKKSFNTLESLYEFEKRFYKEFDDINMTLKHTYIKQTDYKKLNFASTVIINNKKEEPKAPIARKRRG
ncbi:MAG: hypothetical protein PHQ93_08565 [Sulfurimonas sp.]|uniref:hypothetical protein n=1 Tax=Sulfurimonas sp. TaxID=2022749 RepID=UPI002615C2F1|nr:hypothetical protein [Sulfurimonas sp.]MDD5401222.1 hypothetical protein [Sulfurimonas sp.]